MSKEFYNPSDIQKQENSKNSALILIQGSGSVRPGIWARSASIVSNFEIGTMLPQVDWAVNHKQKHAVLILNPNESQDEHGNEIPFNMDMSDHACFVWKHYVENSGF